MLFATNRIPRQSSKSRKRRKIGFNLQETGVSQQMYFCRRNGKHDYTEIGSESFFKELKALPDKTQLLFYIHGFNNTDEKDIFPRAELLQKLFDKTGGKDLVSVVPLIWPCDDDSIISVIDDYWDDQKAADASEVAFARLIGKFDKWRNHKDQQTVPCYKRINILAHSMGNRVLQNALKYSAENHFNGHMHQIFRNLFMVAADVKNHTLERGNNGQYIPDSSRNVVVYYANDDLAMPASKIANIRRKSLSRRLGMTGPENMDRVPKNVYEVDCDNFNNTCDKPAGHAYFLNCPDGKTSPVIKHMVSAIQTGRIVPDKRRLELEKP